LRRLTLLLAALCAAGCATTTQKAAPDLLFTNGRVYTGDDGAPWTEAIAVTGETISALGTSAELQKLAAPQTRVVDLGGKLVIPGINDAHVHAPWPREKVKYARPPRENVTRESVLAAVRSGLEGLPAGMTLTSDLPLALVDAGITRDDLDAISTTVPIRLAVFGGHSAILNTPAMRAWGIAEDAADPAGGWYGRRDGRLDGWLYEHAYWVPQIRLGADATDDELRAQIDAFENEVLGYGITSVQTMPTIPPSRLESLLASRPRRLHWRVMDFRMAPFDGSPAPYPVKYVLDGTPIERTMATIEPYADRPETRGQMNYPAQEIEAMVRDAASGKRHLLVHAVGDRTVDALLGAMERTPADWPALRVRIEHGDALTPELAERARKLGAIVVQNPAHFTIPEVMHARLGPARVARGQLARTLIERGNRFALGSDGPLNPYLNMFFAAIHPTNAAEKLTVEQSLRAYTQGSAFAEFTELKKGRLAPGMLADFAVLSQDIFTVAPDQLPRTTSVMTVMGGKVVHEAK
jgi:predicted amidohydrolase YtcJ